jgi:hypothetical protein
MHELELNKIQGTLEATALFGLVLLNGGAIVAFLNFLGSAGQKTAMQVDLGWARYALFAWCVGVALGALTALAGLWCQSAFAQAYRRRRQAEEWRRLMAAGVTVDEARSQLGLSVGDDQAALNQKADEQRNLAGWWQKLSGLAAALGLAAFLVGARLALYAVEAMER